MSNFTFLRLIIIIALYSYTYGVIMKYREYKKSTKYIGYSDYAILADAMKNEANIEAKVLTIFIPIALIIDLIIIYFK